VDDKATAIIMRDFYKYMKAGFNKKHVPCGGRKTITSRLLRAAHIIILNQGLAAAGSNCPSCP